MADLSNTSSPLPKRKPGIFIQFLGSMNLAVTLLVMLAIASVIGTVLQQNQVFQDYIIKFGPFWTQVFNELGLFHVYGAAWFILVLLFLLISTSVCVSRNGPTFLKEIRQYSEKLSLNAYKHQPHSVTYTPESFETETAQSILKQQGYKTKIHQREDGVTVAGLKGRWNRLGYIFTHISIIVICIGALFDSNLLLKYRELTGTLAPETRTVGLDKIPQKSWLGPENFSFRGSVNIAEGQKSDVLFLPYERGFLVQKLPFTIDVKDFRIEYYDTGMPKSFESDIVLSAPDLDKPIEKTIAVNHPLFYKNYAIYQSSFGDGGSLMKLKVHPLLSPTNNPLTLNTAVDKVEPLKTPMGTYRLELNDFKMFNIVPASEEEKAKTGKKMHNNGPTIIFKVRNDQGKAWEYENYMQPSLQDGRWFFMTGMRTSQAEPFRYLFIPADQQRQKTRFFNFLALINNKNKSQEVLKEAFPQEKGVDDRTYQLQMRLLNQLMVLFRQKGFNGISLFVQKNVPAKDQPKVKDYYMGQTSLALQTLYLNVLKQEKVKELDNISDFNKQWFEDAITVINSLPNYGPPMYFELDSFKQIESTGLQITKSPGKDIVYFGSALLIIGVFFLFYVRQKRIWLAYSEKEGTLTIAGKDNKELPEVAKEFQQIVQAVQSKMQVKS
ncbi:cytochrome c biogenesis protein ResB [Hydrogenovibrio sp. 3SP14C1]|uniref:cytochrome c biogenesis protein ResB n=1 Tax=Hydrogenovibrio sp. 3SP14C1 TaxID=3038774 RepID=UPI0024178B2D|nr:cytochrome c biogenesis protein ResB [Hydrogenovibrio sp. 3SP14C1]MDG4813572.1 cytochrome c biogenesis protein ResB [Hydrogenovibrio sp. 3SP14C1]